MSNVLIQILNHSYLHKERDFFFIATIIKAKKLEMVWREFIVFFGVPEFVTTNERLSQTTKLTSSIVTCPVPQDNLHVFVNWMK